MVAKRRIASETDPAAGFSRAPSRLEPAGAGHAGVESPAMLLQALLDAAVSTSPWAGYVVEPRIEQWPGIIRVAILLGGAGASWAMVWEGLQFLR